MIDVEYAYKAWVKFNMVTMVSGIIVVFLGIMGIWGRYLIPFGIFMTIVGILMEVFLEYYIGPYLDRRYS